MDNSCSPLTRSLLYADSSPTGPLDCVSKGREMSDYPQPLNFCADCRTHQVVGVMMWEKQLVRPLFVYPSDSSGMIPVRCRRQEWRCLIAQDNIHASRRDDSHTHAPIEHDHPSTRDPSAVECAIRPSIKDGALLVPSQSIL